MRSILILICLTLLSITLNAEMLNILVKKSEFPQDRYWSSTTATGTKVYTKFSTLGKQTIADDTVSRTFGITKYMSCANANYMLLNVYPQSETERIAIKTLSDRGYIIIISSWDIINTYIPNHKRYELVIKNSRLNDYPKDYIVAISSGLRVK